MFENCLNVKKKKREVPVLSLYIFLEVGHPILSVAL